jgi:hypothetical protein
MLEQFDIHSKIFFMDVGNFFRYLCVLVLRHQMPASNYFVNSFYSVGWCGVAQLDGVAWLSWMVRRGSVGMVRSGSVGMVRRSSVGWCGVAQ